MNPNEMGDPKVGAMQLIQDLQWKCRVKNEFIRQIAQLVGEEVKKEKLSDEDWLWDLVVRLGDVQREMGEWKRKAMVAIAFGPKNPIPLLGMFLCGAICGFLIRRWI